MVENEREALIKEYEANKRLDMLLRRNQSYKAPKTNPIGYIVLTGLFCLTILAMFFHKSDKEDKCKC